ncbi:MAG: hypothetical protein DMG58_25420 [Acidobacteria bacterium]|nr:MAG: hypothetical protein DMG58_25420 [Acidobacteriota bacterium]
MTGVKTFLVSIWIAAVIGNTGAQAGEAEALAISANIQARHLPFGTILDPVFASSASDQIVGYTRCGDSAIWTGHYLAAEAFRYQVTRTPEALDSVRRALAGIKSLSDVTGTNLLARCLVPSDSPFAAGIRSEEATHGIYTNSSAGYIWVGNTSRDQYSGAIFGLAVAYDMVDDPGVKSTISQLVTLLIDHLSDNAWSVVMPDGTISTTFLVRPDQILTFLQVGRHINPGHFSTLYDVQSFLLTAAVLAPFGVDVLSDDSYFKFNLDYINLYNLIRLDTNVTNTVNRKAYSILRNHTAGHQNAFFDVIDRALNGPDATRDAETLVLLDAWLERPPRDKYVDLHDIVGVCGDRACRPVPVPLRPPADFIWQVSPFQLAGGQSGTIESAGIDYILPYWMARYYSVASPATVQSAASSITTVAPGSIASIYGSSLSAATKQADAQPLPESLGGVSLSVRDATGTGRAASLLYVSPGQINFIVPQDIQPGLATFIVTTGGAAAVSAPGTVLPAAPTLFSASANGNGVAAATAIRTQAGAQGLQAPVPVFQCGASGCVAVPIDLGIDTPVYLSLYGTGIRNRSSLSNVTVTINGVNVPVLYAGSQPEFAGLDQVNVALTLNLRGSGETNVVLVVDGQTANPVTLNVR